MSRPHVLIVGASGVFGSRLARLLARRRAFQVTLAGRTVEKIHPLQSELLVLDPEGGYQAVRLDRGRVAAEDLRKLGCGLVVDCSGPFQTMGTNLIEAAIGAPCHYVDLADSRAFVAAIGSFDAAAKAAGIAVLSGASSSPCLSNAVLDRLTANWTSVDTIDCAIVPGNQTPKGKSVIDGILSWVGQPIAVFREAEWQIGRGWTGARRIKIDGVPPRWALLAEVPDLDILPARFAPRLRAGFDAGMELGLLNGLIWLSGLAVRWRLVRSARAFSALGNMIANALDGFGSQDGGMRVDVAGVDSTGEPRRAVWELKASKGHGPYVPVGPAAALIEQLMLSDKTVAGASSAAGHVDLDAILPWYAALNIETRQITETAETPVFQQVLGERFSQLPEATRRLHRGRPAVIASGSATVQPAQSVFGRLVALLFRLPTKAGELPIEVVIESRDGQECWTRRFDDHAMRSIICERAGLIEERFGPVAIAMRLEATPSGLEMYPVGGRFTFVPLPRFLLPKVVAKETSEAGRHMFDVDIGLPIIGRLVAYRGSLDLEDSR